MLLSIVLRNKEQGLSQFSERGGPPKKASGATHSASRLQACKQGALLLRYCSTQDGCLQWATASAAEGHALEFWA